MRHRRPTPWRVSALLLCVALAAPRLSLSDPGEQYERALAAFEAKSYSEAVVHLKNALRQRPDDLPSLVLLGRTAVALRNGAAAEEALTRARRQGAHDSVLFEPLAEAYLLQRKFDRLLEEYEVTDHPLERQAAVMLLRTRAYVERNQLPQAEQVISDATTLFPGNGVLWQWRVRVALAQSDRNDAELALRRARKTAPETSETWFLSGELQRMGNRPREAITDYGEALRYDPDHIGARISRAALSLDLGDPERAAEDVRTVLASEPGHPQARYLSALVLARGGDLNAARAELTELSGTLNSYDGEAIAAHGPSLLLLGAIEFLNGSWNSAGARLRAFVDRFPDNAGARRLLGIVRIEQGKLDEGIAILESVRETQPADVALLGALGEAYLRTGRYAEARSVLERAVSLEPTKTGIRTGLALSHLRVGDKRKAVAELEIAIELDPSSSRPQLLLGRLQLEQGDAKGAMETGDRLADLDPTNPQHFQLAAEAAAALGDRPGARARLAAALKADPGFLAAHEGLARLDMEDGKPQSAVARLEALAERYRANAAVHNALSFILESQGRISDAIRAQEKAVAQASEKRDLEIRLVALYVRGGRPKEALSLAQRMAENDPEAFAGWYALGRVQLQLGMPEEARAAFAKAGELSSANITGEQRFALAEAQIAAGDPSGARSALLPLVKLRPRHFGAHAVLAALDIRAGMPELADARGIKLQTDFPAEALGYLLSGDALVGLGRYREALAAYEAAQARDPKADLTLQRYWAKRAAGDHAGAIDELDRHAVVPGDSALARRIAMGYLESGRYETAATHHARLLETSPDDPVLLNNYAWLLGKLGDSRALAYARRAHDLAPESPSVLDTLGRLLIESGDAKQAVPFLRRARIRLAADPGVAYHLALALSRTGREAEARQLLGESLASKAGFPEAAEAQALLSKLAGD